jgi:shikimate kinase
VSAGIVLLGFMGAGKTTVGRALAARLEWPFADLDALIEEREGQSIREIFLQRGESAFREAEAAALNSVLERIATGPHVLALGGGTPMSRDNLAKLESSRLLSVYLDAPIEDLWQRSRLSHPDRPLRRDKARFRKLNETRRPTYLRAALIIETGGKEVETVVEEILAHVHSTLAKGATGEPVSL